LLLSGSGVAASSSTLAKRRSVTDGRSYASIITVDGASRRMTIRCV
jgi:hypothetical protein